VVTGRISARDPERLLALAEVVLGHTERASAAEAEVLVMAEDAALTRFANSQIHQNVAEESIRIAVRFVDGRRVGVASTGRVDDTGLADVAARAADIARHTAERPDWGGLPGPGPVAAAHPGVIDDHGGFSEATADATPELRAEGVRAVIAAADELGVVASGSFSTGVEGHAVANSHGIRAATRRTVSQVLTVQMGPDGGNGYAEACAVDATTLDASAIGREAASKARASAGPVSLEPGDYPVVLEEYAVVDLLDMLGYLGFSALAVEEERSFVEPGRVVGSELVSLWDDGHDPAGLPLAVDYEGVAKERVQLIERGVCRDVVFDAETAARAGKRSTGHGLPAPNPYGPFPLNMLMAGGEASRDELIGGLDRGLLVTRFHYTNPVHPKLAIVTGMTRDGTFLVEAGQVVGPVKNLRYTQSYLEALAGVQAIGRERRVLRGFLGGAVVSPVRIASWTFTGATEH
jgi:predicted Zn-dependent protease